MKVVVRSPSWERMTLHASVEGAAREYDRDCQLLRLDRRPIQETVEVLEEGLPVTMVGHVERSVTYHIQEVID